MILLPSGIVNDDRLSTSSKQLRHIVNNIILDKKKEITAPILCIGTGCHGVPDGAPRRHAPMHNIGADRPLRPMHC